MFAASHLGELIPLGLAQLDPVSYVHRRPPKIEGTTDEPWLRAGSRRSAPPLHAEAGAVSGIHPRLYAGARPATGRSRPAAPLSRHATFSPPDADDARARRPHPTSAGRRAQHTIVDRSQLTATANPEPRSTGQNHRARVLEHRREQTKCLCPVSSDPAGSSFSILAVPPD